MPACFTASLLLTADAEIHFVNMTALTRGRFRSSFWIVDRKHVYIGSADMDWRSLSKVTTNLSIRRTAVRSGFRINTVSVDLKRENHLRENTDSSLHLLLYPLTGNNVNVRHNKCDFTLHLMFNSYKEELICTLTRFSCFSTGSRTRTTVEFNYLKGVGAEGTAIMSCSGQRELKVEGGGAGVVRNTNNWINTTQLLSLFIIII